MAKESTVNGKKYPDKIIEGAAGKMNKVKFTYFACGKGPNEKEKMKAKENNMQPSISLIDSLRKDGQIIKETNEYVAIKAYSEENPNKATIRKEDITH